MTFRRRLLIAGLLSLGLLVAGNHVKWLEDDPSAMGIALTVFYLPHLVIIFQFAQRSWFAFPGMPMAVRSFVVWAACMPVSYLYVVVGEAAVRWIAWRRSDLRLESN